MKGKTGPETERLWLGLLWADRDLLGRARPLAEARFFSRENRPFAEILFGWFDEYGTVPDVELVRARLGKDPEPWILHVDRMDAERREALYRWFSREWESWCKRSRLAILLREAAERLGDDGIDEIVERFVEATSVRMDDDPGINPFVDPASLVRRLKEKAGTIPTGWKVLDEKLYGGMNRGEISIFVGLPGTGKSLFLQNITFNWIQAGLKVVYFTLELSAELCGVRMLAMASGQETRSIMRNPDSLRPWREASDRLYIKYLPSGSTVRHLEAHLRLLDGSFGFVPDAIVVDYLDEMEPLRRNRAEADRVWVRDKIVTQELRDLAVRRGAVCVTATQMNRTAVEEDDARMDHIAGGMTKLHVADNAFAIRTGDARGNIYRLKLLKTRSSSGVGSFVDLAFDSSCLRITDLDGDSPVDSRFRKMVITNGKKVSATDRANEKMDWGDF